MSDKLTTLRPDLECFIVDSPTSTIASRDKHWKNVKLNKKCDHSCPSCKSQQQSDRFQVDSFAKGKENFVRISGLRLPHKFVSVEKIVAVTDAEEYFDDELAAVRSAYEEFISKCGCSLCQQRMG